ncbi:hypothetical protein [Hyphomicrobium sp.]|uniref:hypothetical protein n=1 Tax=Hyphomicrobium sp. TaxID=82 RepID=UPI001D1BF19F|nr:hypothetical protein [Hyphomicrobium sp.]MBY0561221.1 hypothetical protein [Hyphomicrobium sp.]
MSASPVAGGVDDVITSPLRMAVFELVGPITRLSELGADGSILIVSGGDCTRNDGSCELDCEVVALFVSTGLAIVGVSGLLVVLVAPVAPTGAVVLCANAADDMPMIKPDESAIKNFVIIFNPIRPIFT